MEMFGGFLKGKFFTKCKSALSRIKIRIEAAKRKKNAVQKYLKNDIADLLQNGYQLNAYSRAEGLLIEINMSACYDLVEQFCKTILEHLSVMNKQKECPEECKEAVPSLMFAAARFSDLPELRELRTLFANKYGRSLEPHINQELVEKLKAIHPTKDVKIQLLNDVASEFELEWHPKVLEQQLYKPSPSSEQVCSENADGSEIKIATSRNRPAPERDKLNLERDIAPTTNEENKVPSLRMEASDDDNGKSHGGIANEKADNKKPISYKFIPPPYTKQRAGDSETGSGVHSNSPGNPSAGENKPKPKSVRRRQLKPLSSKDDSNDDGKGKKNSAGTENDNKNSDLKIVLEDEGEDKIEKRDIFHSRTVSLPPAEVSTSETKKGHGRTLSSPEYDHPKLLDYDDFIARLAALRQNER